jgi:hypothetical protein
MKSPILAAVLVLVLGSVSYAGWYVVPQGVYAYHPYYSYYPYYAAAPVYAYPPPMVAAPQVAYSPVLPGPQVAYSPVLPGPQVVYSPVVPAPVYAPPPVPYWYGPPAVVVRGKVYLPGRPIRNVVRWVVP